MTKKVMAMILIIAIIFTFCACVAESGENIVFGTFYTIKIKGSSSRKDLKKISDLFKEIEKEVSTSIVESDVYRINNSPVGLPIEVGRHTKSLFLTYIDLYQFTDGAFNAAIFPLVELWKFSPDTYTGVVSSIPTNEQINEYISYCDINHFEFNEQNQTITRLHKKAKLDFGGIAKGYAIDLAKEICVNNKDALINVGGNITTFGSQKRIGLTHPRNTSSLFGVINMQNTSIATSGDYERYYIFEGIRYNHIIAKDGHPTGTNNNDIISASVIGKSALMCDALSTSVMILGTEWAEQHLPAKGYSSIIITEQNYKFIGEINFESRETTHQRI